MGCTHLEFSKYAFPALNGGVMMLNPHLNQRFRFFTALACSDNRRCELTLLPIQIFTERSTSQCLPMVFNRLIMNLLQEPVQRQLCTKYKVDTSNKTNIFVQLFRTLRNIHG